MDMKYGLIAESQSVNKAIYDCFYFLNEKEQSKFVKKFKEQPHTKIQIMNTFRELLLGAYLIEKGFAVENDNLIGKKTPDWSVLNSANEVTAIVELVNHYIDNKTNGLINAKRNAGKIAIAYFPDGFDPEHNRLYSQIQDKASKYKYLVAELRCPYVVAVFMDFLANIEDTRNEGLLIERG